MEPTQKRNTVVPQWHLETCARIYEAGPTATRARLGLHTTGIWRHHNNEQKGTMSLDIVYPSICTVASNVPSSNKLEKDSSLTSTVLS